jgi:formylmethanofuran dehydrogenase subunit E
MDLSERHKELIAKVRDKQATTEEREEFERIHQEKSLEVLNLPAQELFNIEAIQVPLPEKATMEPSEICDQCGEMTMASKLKEADGRRLCESCRK